jgi:hypothetical protein
MGVYIKARVLPPTYDPDAQAFFTASGLTGATNLSAINNLVVALKGYGIWTKMRAIYPFVGGTATTHKFNLKNPLDTNAAFRLVFFGGMTHSANGIQGNGTNSYANTFLNPSAITNNNHMSIYVRTNIDEVKEDIGNYNGSVAGFGIDSRISNVAYYTNHSSFGGQYVSFINADSRGFHINTRNSSSNHKGFLNGILKGTNTSAGTTAINFDVYVGARNNSGTAQIFSSKQFAFASIGDGLTDTDAGNFYTAVQAFQTTLGRQV